MKTLPGPTDAAPRPDDARSWPPSLQRVAILRARDLGDMLCAVPALRALRSALPGAHITLIGLPWARVLVQRLGRYLDGFLALPGVSGLPEQPPAPLQFPMFAQRVANLSLDLLIQMHGDGKVTNPLISRLQSEYAAGFHPAGGTCPDRRLFAPYPNRGREIQRLLGLVQFLGAPSRGEFLEFPVLPDDRAEAREASGGQLHAGSYVCLHPGGRDSAPKWSPERFARLGDALSGRGLHVVLTGDESERDLTGTVARRMSAPALDLAGQTSVAALAAVVEGARVLVSNDAGVAHLAEALGTPSVVLFDPPRIERWAPAQTLRHRVVAPVETAHPARVFAECTALISRFPTRSRPSAVVATAVS